MKVRELDALCVNTIRMLSVDMVEKANSGHPGMPMGMAPAAYVLWTKAMKYNPGNPAWPDRDRFVLSAGHGSALLYSILYLTGYDLTMDDLKNFRQWESKTPGHTEYGATPGVECTTGPLGQGFANGVGMAIAERYLAARLNRPGFEIVDHYTYAICSDGDLMEGVATEAASLAGHLKLGKLIYLYDNNHVTLSGETRLTFTEDVSKRFEAYGWHVQSVEDGNDLEAIAGAIKAAKDDIHRPSLIMVQTHIGYGSPGKQDTFEAHGSPLGPDETKATKENLGWPVEPSFYVPEKVLEYFRKAAKRTAESEELWMEHMRSYQAKYPELMEEWEQMMGPKLPEGWDVDLPLFKQDPKGIATRSAGGKFLKAVADRIPSLVGGSADLDPSTMTAMEGRGEFQGPGTGDENVQGAVKGHWGYGGANIAYGLREHAMCAITTGLALHGGLLPYAATFFVFADYMKPAIRLAALSGVRAIYVFTHDSIGLGEDGPTHQPVEQLASLRAMPGIKVIRPADANETVEAWKAALINKKGPTALIFSRQNLPVIDRVRYAPAAMLHKGGYVLAEPPTGKPEIILIATGSEVHLALEAYDTLNKEGIKTRVVNMPCWELYELQPAEYKKSVLPPEVTARVSIEAGATFGWSRYIGVAGLSIGVDRFGSSAPGNINMKEYGFSAENITDAAHGLLAKKG